MCHRWCYGKVILQKWQILSAWVLSVLLCACFAGVWTSLGSPKSEDTSGLLATGVALTTLTVLFGIGSCLASVCAPDKSSKVAYFAVNTDQPAHVVVDQLEDVEMEARKHMGSPPFPEMLPKRNGKKVVLFAANGKDRGSKLPKRQDEQKRVELRAMAHLAAAAAGVPEPAVAMPAAAPEPDPHQRELDGVN